MRKFSGEMEGRSGEWMSSRMRMSLEGRFSDGSSSSGAGGFEVKVDAEWVVVVQPEEVRKERRSVI